MEVRVDISIICCIVSNVFCVMCYDDNVYIHACALPQGAPAICAITSMMDKSPDTANTRPTTLSAAAMSSSVRVLSGRGAPLTVPPSPPLLVDGSFPGGGPADIRPVARCTCGLENGFVCDHV
jgi:hypothetical protein